MDSFVIISLLKKGKEGVIPKWRHRLPRSMYERYLIHKLPILMEDITLYGERGRQIVIPFDEAEAERLGKDFVTSFVNAAVKKYDLDNLYIEKETRNFLSCDHQDYGSLLLYMMLPAVLEMKLEEKGSSYRELYPVILDSGDKRIEYVLEWLTMKVNHLILVTERPSYFEAFHNLAYEELGLVVEILEPAKLGGTRGNLFIDAGSGLCREYRSLGETAEVISLGLAKEEIRYLEGRRPCRDLIYDVAVSMNGEAVFNDLAAVILCGKSWKLRRFAMGQMNMFYLGEIEQLNQFYCLKIEKIIRQKLKLLN